MSQQAVGRMLEARTVAVVGASARPGSLGNEMLHGLIGGGFHGRTFPVNPRYREIEGVRCLPSVADIGEPVDLVLLGVPDRELEAQLEAAAGQGAGAAVVFSSCYERPHPGLPGLALRLASIASDAGMALCGPNSMGFLNLETGLRACGYRMPGALEAGSIALISHSGSAFAALLHNRRGLCFNLAVSSGLEVVSTATDYLRYALGRPSTRAVALFLETIRDPAGFAHSLEQASRQDVPVVVLKVGRNEHSRAMVAAHSGALAGDDGAYEALFDAHGALRVGSLDEMADTLELFVAGRRAAPGALASVHDSGGERALLSDRAEGLGVPLANLSTKTLEALDAVLEPGLDPDNPLDAWGSGKGYERIFTECMNALLDDPGVGALALSVDLTTETSPEGGYLTAVKEAFERTRKPVAVLSNLASAIEPRDSASLRASGIPVLEGTDTGLRAFRHLFDYRDHRTLPPLHGGVRPPADVRMQWRARLSSGEPVSEAEGLALLSAYGMTTVAARSAASLDEAAAAAAELGWPVALKTAAPGIAHKAAADGVRLGLKERGELAAAYAELARNLGPRVTVARMRPPGVELALGIVRDDQFGPLLVAAAGGVWVELLGDRAVGLPPLDGARALRLVSRLKAARLLDHDGRAAVARAVAALSALAEDLADVIDAVDVNPVIVGAGSCVAVDALIVHRADSSDGAKRNRSRPAGARASRESGKALR